MMLPKFKVIYLAALGIGVVVGSFYLGLILGTKECPKVETRQIETQGTDDARIDHGEVRFFLEGDSIKVKEFEGYYRFGYGMPDASMEIWKESGSFDSIRKAKEYSRELALRIIKADEDREKEKLIKEIEDRMWDSVIKNEK